MAQYPENYTPPSKVAFDITAATVVKASSGALRGINVLVGGAAGTISDSASAAGNTAANQLGAIPDVVGYISFNPPIPFKNGLVITPGAAQVVVAFYY